MPEEAELQALNEDWERGLAVVAHPDDLEYGAASAVAKWTSQGKSFTYLLITRGQAGIDGMEPAEAGPLRAEEERRSAAAVGVERVDFLDYEDGCIEYGLQLRKDVARSIRRQKPEVLLTSNFQLTWGAHYLNMADHRAVGLAVLDAARDAGNRWIFPELRSEGLEPWTGVKSVLFFGSPEPTHFVDVTGFLDRGIASLEEHKAYIKGLGGDFDPEKFLRGSAEGLGRRVGTELAISFEVFHV